MAHLIEQMAYVNATPWHGLGNPLTPCQPIDVWQRQAGMHWQIHEAPVYFMDHHVGNHNALLFFPEHKVLYRSDTNARLAVVSQRFKVVQPRKMLEFYRDLTDLSGFALETAGVLHGGRKLWALARTGQSTALKDNDLSQAYVLLATACDGTLSTTAQFTVVRVVCNNTLAVALMGNTCAVKVPHNTAFDPQAVKRQLGTSVSAWEEFMYRMKGLSERPVTADESLTYFRNVFVADSIEGISHPGTCAVAAALTLFEGKGRGAALASAKGTAFGLLNAVTQFVDHERRARSTDHRLESAWFVDGARLKHKALDQALLTIA